MSQTSNLKLWTIHDKKFFDLILEKEETKADWNFISFPEFKEPYLYMISQMKKRGIPIDDNHPPIWAWEKKPDLRRGGHLEQGTEGVRIEISVPESLVLLSDFDAWHFVLNNTYIGYSEEEFDEYFKLEKPNRYDKLKKSSWEQIFKDYPKNTDHFAAKDRVFQATLPYIKKEWIRSYKFFKGK